MSVLVEDPLGIVNREPWTEYAACRGRWTEFDEHGSHKLAEYAAAIRICRSECPVLLQCRRYAVGIAARDGVWGGELFGSAGTPIGGPR